ncbi:carotenoid biosynthesis protein [Nocardia bovistercoris]|uniref:carotenoid biosynthesis protein n=1 Tax=Nocardia bovistercoris TaxID=2785916 RepID=UPI002FCCE6B8
MTLTRSWVPALCAILLVAAQICYPLADGSARDAVTVAVVLLSAATALTHAAATRGAGFALRLLVIVSGLGLLAEAVGTATGYPFGCYAYAQDRIGPAVAGVPVIVALAWTGGLYPVWVVATELVGRGRARVVLTAVGAVGWDLFLDPQMAADGQWRWCDTVSGLPGLADIPITNYAGWFAVALVMASMLETADRRDHPAPSLVFRAETAVPVLVFLWTWLGSALAHAVFLDLPASAIYGALGMGLLGIPLLAAMAVAASRN